MSAPTVARRDWPADKRRKALEECVYLQEFSLRRPKAKRVRYACGGLLSVWLPEMGTRPTRAAP